MVCKSTWYNHNTERQCRPRQHLRTADTGSRTTRRDPSPDSPSGPSDDIDVTNIKEPPSEGIDPKNNEVEPTDRSPNPVSTI